jgi:hypothetical protein
MQLNGTRPTTDDLTRVGETLGTPRTFRVAAGGMVFRALNRGVGRMRGSLKDDDFEAFERGKQSARQLRTCFEIRRTLIPTLCRFKWDLHSRGVRLAIAFRFTGGQPADS